MTSVYRSFEKPQSNLKRSSIQEVNQGKTAAKLRQADEMVQHWQEK